MSPCSPAGRNVACALAKPFYLAPLVGEAQFGDRPEVGIEVDPFLLAANVNLP